jgi:hypothetical protein
MGTPYYFSNDQIAKIKKRWKKVNPETNSGVRFQSDIKYMINMASDLENINS